ncbi:MAG TPA: Cache 3/Cache 2 fusion domain-containing protein, partial [Thermodesulfobacteriota bacterium]|nr:Cache 3/Cache 2 fusion domain-containing protein [Thermodesulfobacteriota bacterium]
MKTFRDWKIRTKLIVFTLLLGLVPMGIAAMLSLDKFTEDLKHVYESDLEHIVANIYAMGTAQQELLQEKLTSDLRVAHRILYRHGDHIDADPGRPVEFTAEDQFTREAFRVRVPFWSIGGQAVTGNDSIVDAVQQLVGGTCTIFQRIEGDRLLRISTNVLRADGRRAVGTFLPAGNEVTRTILKGETYRGRAFVVNDWYITAYEPIWNRSREVIGALYVGIPEQKAVALKAAIKSIKIGKSGYAFIMDSSGRLIVHPEKEGEVILDSKDSSGFAYIREMVQKAPRLKENEVGTLRYSWTNIESGESRP